MILEKYKNRYSFNFLAVCGWIVFAWFCKCEALFPPNGVGGTAFPADSGRTRAAFAARQHIVQRANARAAGKEGCHQ